MIYSMGSVETLRRYNVSSSNASGMGARLTREVDEERRTVAARRVSSNPRVWSTGTGRVRSVASINLSYSATGPALYAPASHTPPMATDDELKTVLHVKNVDLHVEENAKAHRTSDYECTARRPDEGFGSEPELVIRRGGYFTMTATFDREYSLAKDDMQIMVDNGPKSQLYSTTHARFDVDETGAVKFEPLEWGARLLRKTGNQATFEVHVAADCAIGVWTMSVLTKSKLAGEKVKLFKYECPESFIVLFNPWCKDDTVYMDDPARLEEYVLNDHGAVWQGNKYSPRGRPWNFGQFEDGILEASLHLIMRCFRPNEYHLLADPVRVSRAIGQAVNCSDEDEGCLCGNWSGDYTGGESPSSWHGSVRILHQFLRTKEMVKFGQCWVFSGVTTTVCRAVGIPALSVTNFASAHDNNENTVIEKFYCRNDDGDLEPDGGDSVWNFHVWNQVWMCRPDIPYSNGKYDGWQAIDATPQERSGGLYQCGPAPLAAIKEGHVGVPYDTAFVFAEVNADMLYIEKSCGQMRKIKVTTDKIGRCISTKIPDSLPFQGNATKDCREDVTHLYKYPERSEENRAAVMRAARGAKRVCDFYTGDPEKQDVKFKLVHDNRPIFGTDLDVTLKVKNVSNQSRLLGNVQFRFSATKYTGQAGKIMKKHLQRVNRELEPGRDYEYSSSLPVADYMSDIDENRHIFVEAFATVRPSNGRPIQHCFKAHVATLQEPYMQVKLPRWVKAGQGFEASLVFTNPLAEELTDCTAGYEGRGFKHVTGVRQNNVRPYARCEITFPMITQKKGRFNLTFKFTSKQLQNLSASGNITVE